MLVKIEEYDGDFISQSVLEALEIIGLVNKLNTLGYHINVEPIHQKTPKGMIEDTPSNHKVIIDRNKFIDKMTPSQFRKKVRTEDYKDKVCVEQSELYDIPFKDKDGVSIRQDVTVDGTNYVWYKHSIELKYKREVIQDIASYIKDIFEKTADYVIQSIDDMQTK